MSEMSGRTAECWHKGQISTKSGKSFMNAFLRARTAFGFEYLISFRAEHNDADRDITGIEGPRNNYKTLIFFFQQLHIYCNFVLEHSKIYSVTHTRGHLGLSTNQKSIVQQKIERGDLTGNSLTF